MQLESARLIIREFGNHDFDGVHAYASDPEVTEFTMWGPNTKEDTLKFLEDMIQMQEERPRTGYELALVLKDSGQLIGGVGLHQMNRNAELGYCLNKNYWRKGYASEAAKALCRFGFEQLDVHRIYATCRPGNIGSASVMRSIGMKQEGHLRQHLHYKGSYHDSYLYSILKDEFTIKSST